MGKTKKVEYKRMIFDSKLELNIYKYFEDHPNIKILSRQNSYKLFPSIKYYCIKKGKIRTLRQMIYTPDYKIKLKGHKKEIEIECKGFARPVYLLRKKIFLNLWGHIYDFIELGSLKETKEIFDKYKESD